MPAKRMRRLLLGADPRLARMLGYWAATCLLYFIGAVPAEAGAGIQAPSRRAMSASGWSSTFRSCACCGRTKPSLCWCAMKLTRPS